MIELKGKYSKCKIFSSNVDNGTIGQLMTLLNQKSMQGNKIRIMPDNHQGKGCVIGTTMTLTDKVIPNLVGVDVGCVDKDTEYLTVNGWVKISEYDGEEIATYDLKSNTTFFEKPIAFIKLPESKFYRLKTKYGIDQMISREHRCLLRKGFHNRKASQDKPYVITAEELYNKHSNLKTGLRDNFICDIPNMRSTGLNLSDNELRLLIMYQADGFKYRDRYACKFKKQRKIDRCKNLLDNAGILYKEHYGIDGTTTIEFKLKSATKDLRCLYKCNVHQLAVICDEVMHWDGNTDSMQYWSKYSYNVDFIQYAFACNGYRTSIDCDKRSDAVYWRVIVSDSRPRVQLAGAPKTNINIVDSEDGFKYCFTTSTSFWVMRRNGCICLTGNCGMLAVKLKEKRVDLPALDSVIRKYVPSGGNVHNDTNEDRTSLRVDDLRCFGKPGANIRADLAYQSVGTLGGGNHFIEINRDSNDNLWLVIHTGSRHLGLEICNYYQNLGYEKLKQQANDGTRKEKLDALIAKLKAEGRQSEINKEIKKFNDNYTELNPSIPHELAYVEGQDFADYIHDMKLVQAHAVCNRAEIARVILKYAKLHEIERFETIHNYIDTDDMILRKGSISCKLGEKVIIPINMRDGSLICIGKGNPDWNFSGPHGAGRLMSRSMAKQSLSVSDFKKTMKDAGIYSTSVNKSTIDESPMAYKTMDEIIKNIEPTAEVIDIIKPIYNFKAGEED